MYKSLLFYLIVVPKFNGSVQKGAPGHKHGRRDQFSFYVLAAGHIGIHFIKAGLVVIYHFRYLLDVLGHIPLGLGAD